MPEDYDVLDDRLVELLYRDLSPEDYDFLLELDENNHKNTLKEGEDSLIKILRVVNEGDMKGLTEEQLTCGVCYCSVAEDKEEGINEQV